MYIVKIGKCEDMWKTYLALHNILLFIYRLQNKCENRVSSAWYLDYTEDNITFTIHSFHSHTI